MLKSPASKFQFAVERKVAANIDSVFEVLTSEAGMRQWISGCRSVEWRHPAGVTQPGLGSLRHIVLAGGIVAPERIIGWEQGRGLHYTFDGGSLPISRLVDDYVGVTRLEATGPNSTKLTWAVHFNPRDRFGLTGLLLRGGLRPAITLMARNIGRAAEARQPR